MNFISANSYLHNYLCHALLLDDMYCVLGEMSSKDTIDFKVTLIYFQLGPKDVMVKLTWRNFQMAALHLNIQQQAETRLGKNKLHELHGVQFS